MKKKKEKNYDELNWEIRRLCAMKIVQRDTNSDWCTWKHQCPTTSKVRKLFLLKVQGLYFEVWGKVDYIDPTLDLYSPCAHLEVKLSYLETVGPQPFQLP